MSPFDAYKLDIEIIPGVLEQEWDAIEKKIELVKPFAKSIHVDLLDGKFAPNTTWMDPMPFKKYASDLLLEVHMMVENPLQYLKPFADAGFKRFIGHIEKMPDLAEFIAEAQLLGEVGLAIDTQTPVSNITVSYEDLDFILVMSVKAGFSRQSFLPEAMEKVKEIRAKAEFIPIEVDGGISEETITKAHETGATRFVSTGFLFGGTDPHEQYKKLLEKVF